MNSLIKSVMILSGTLIVGIIAGATVTGALVRGRLEYIRAFSEADGFVLRFFEIVGPLTDEQRAEVEPILRASGVEIEATFGGAGKQVYAIIERLEKDLIPHLSAEQAARLQERRVEIRNRYIGRFTVVTEEQLRGEE